MKTISRREFARTSLVATGLVALPNIIPARLLGANAPSNRVRVGQIGCGRIAQGHDMPSVFHPGLADYVAVCDLDSRRTADGRALVKKFYQEKELPEPRVDVYGDYRELLA